jgi:hypothetical protein
MNPTSYSNINTIWDLQIKGIASSKYTPAKMCPINISVSKSGEQKQTHQCYRSNEKLQSEDFISHQKQFQLA